MKCHEGTRISGKSENTTKIKQRSGSIDSSVKNYDEKYILSSLEDAAGTGVNFTNVSLAAFVHADSKKRKKYS